MAIIHADLPLDHVTTAEVVEQFDSVSLVALLALMSEYFNKRFTYGSFTQFEHFGDFVHHLSSLQQDQDMEECDKHMVSMARYIFYHQDTTLTIAERR